MSTKAVLGLLLLLPSGPGSGAGGASPRPQPGDAAPSFTAPSTTGKPIGLADFVGKKTLVLAFFPKAFTSG